MASYDTDRQWSDHMLPQIMQIVGPLLLVPATVEEDCKQATDLIVLRGRDMRVAARVRRPGYGDKYPFEITLRARRDSGNETELSKIVNGWGDWFFYGHADRSHWIDRWWLVDLNAFRAGLIRASMNGAAIRCGDKPNGDGTYFKWFDLRSFSQHPPILVAGSHPLSESEAA